MIEVQNLCKRFDRTTALDGVNLTVHSGVVSGILGPNACGKTSLIKAILGLMVPDAGKISVCGIEVDGSGLHRAKIGYLPQYPEFPANLTVSELFDLAQDIRGHAAPRRLELVGRFGLEGVLLRRISVLSGGMRQKVAAVLAFMFDAPVLILDEPTVGLDPVAALKLKQLIRESADSGKSVLVVSHILSEAEQLFGSITFLLDGRVQFGGSIEEIKAHAGCLSLEDAVIKLMSSKHEGVPGSC